MGAGSFENFGTKVENTVNKLNLFHQCSENNTLTIHPLELKGHNDTVMQQYGFPGADQILANSNSATTANGDHYFEDHKGKITNFQYADQNGEKGHDFLLHYDRDGNVNMIDDRTANQKWIATGNGNWSDDAGKTEHKFGTVSADQNGLHATDDATALQIPGITDKRRVQEIHVATGENDRGEYHVNENGKVDEFQAQIDQHSCKFEYDANGSLKTIETPDGDIYEHHGRLGWSTPDQRGFIQANITVDETGFHATDDKVSQDFLSMLNQKIVDDMQEAPEPENLHK
jgi:hypothetical protein